MKHQRISALRNVLLIISATCINGCKEQPREADVMPNILWINLDDARADALGSYGKSWAQTPNMDMLASKGVRFHNAIVQNPVCVPSRNSMKSGYYAHETGPVGMGKVPEIQGDYIDQLKMEQINNSPCLLDIWTDAGIKPVNVGKIHARHSSFDARGDAPVLLNHIGNPTRFFMDSIGDMEDLFVGGLTAKTRKYNWLLGGILNVQPELTETWRLGDMAINELRALKNKEKPFFFRVSFHAPHVACYVPKEYYLDPAGIDLAIPTDHELSLKPDFEKGPLNIYAGADLNHEQIDLARGTYYGMVTLVDVQVGRILSFLENDGLLDNTIVAITSDQGFQLGEHGLWKKRVFYEGNVRAPLILYYPKSLPKNLVVEEPVELIDFIPTLLELSGFEVPDDIRGRSLMPLINGNVKEWRKACFSEIDHSQSMYDELRQGSGRRVMVRTKEWKLVYFMDNRVKDKDGALYNLQTDPDEKINLYKDSNYLEVIKMLEALADAWDRGDNLFITNE